LGPLASEPVGHVQGHAGVEKRRRGRRIGSMDGTESLGPIHYQLHTAGRRVHSIVGARRPAKNTILGPKSSVRGLPAMAHCSGFLHLQRTSLYASAWGNRDSQAEERSPNGDRGFGSIHDVFVFWIKGGRPVTANRLVQTEIRIDRSVHKAVGLVAIGPPAPANKTSKDE
jgi:hypothetical protein